MQTYRKHAQVATHFMAFTERRFQRGDAKPSRGEARRIRADDAHYEKQRKYYSIYDVYMDVFLVIEHTL